MPPEPPIPTTGRNALYELCDRATGQDPRCWSTRFGNDLRALENSLLAPEEYGGQTRTEVDGAQGLAAAAPVGIDVDSLGSTLVGIDLRTDEENSSGPCRTAFDPTAKLGVVTVMTDGPRGPIEAVQAYIIVNPVFRIGRPLADAAAGLGPAGIGVLSSLADLRAAYPDIEVAPGDGRTIAATPPEQAREQLAATTSERRMFFILGEDDRVETWLVGVPQYAAYLCG